MKVNGKLTDFGSSRNINLLMTNMTFTKGIGTPKYMAPEMLNKEKYKNWSDIYSFGISMLEMYCWKDPFPKSEFKFPWDIANKISSGQRPKLIEEVTNEEMTKIIEGAWKQEPKERTTIDAIVSSLQSFFDSL